MSEFGIELVGFGLEIELVVSPKRPVARTNSNESKSVPVRANRMAVFLSGKNSDLQEDSDFDANPRLNNIREEIEAYFKVKNGAFLWQHNILVAASRNR
jgi:hypothetical protein